MNEKRTDKISSIISIIAGFFLFILIAVLGIIDNVTIINVRHDSRVVQVENYSCDRVEKEDAPAGVVDVYKFKLGDNLAEGQYLAFYTLHQYTEVYIGDELVYSITKSDENIMTDTYGSDWITIPLGRPDEGKDCTIIITPAYEFVETNNLEIYIGPAFAIYERTFKRDIIQLVLGVVALFMGLLLMIVSFINWRKKEVGSNIFCLGIFTILLGLWRITNVRFTPFLDFNKPTFFMYVAFASLMMVVPPLIKSIRSRYKSKTRIVLDILSITISSVCIIEVILQLFGVIDIRELLWLTNGLIVISGMLALGCSIYDKVKYKHSIGESPDKYLTIIIIGGILDIILFYANNRSTNLICTLASVNIYVIFEGMTMLFEYVNNQKKLAEQERQLIDKELAIKMSQIQPHFLYNSLTSIHYLCDKDPKLAKKAVKWFSTYLRGNLESMSKENMVPFSQELSHIEIYLKLEKLRFGEYLDIVYNIEEEDFMIPTLAIQPLVENAVKYGVGDKKEGGQVIIGTTSTDTHYIVTIEDTGTGFDINEEKHDGRQHVGIANVKERLNMICNGELIIHSEIDKGTVAIIRIPKDYGGGVKYENTSSR